MGRCSRVEQQIIDYLGQQPGGKFESFFQLCCELEIHPQNARRCLRALEARGVVRVLRAGNRPLILELQNPVENLRDK